MPLSAGPFSAKLALLFSYAGASSDFTGIPRTAGGPWLPGPALALPAELSLGNWSLVFSPAGHLFFTGEDAQNGRFAAPARFAGSFGAGAYYEGRNFLAGVSGALRSPDVGGEVLDWTLWTAVEGRYDLQASFLGCSVGMRALDADPILLVRLEFGVIL